MQPALSQHLLCGAGRWHGGAQGRARRQMTASAAAGGILSGRNIRSRWSTVSSQKGLLYPKCSRSLHDLKCWNLEQMTIGSRKQGEKKISGKKIHITANQYQQQSLPEVICVERAGQLGHRQQTLMRTQFPYLESNQLWLQVVTKCLLALMFFRECVFTKFH